MHKASLSLQKAEHLFKAVSNERRVKILRYLSDCKQATVGNISAHLRITPSATSRHLNQLEREGFLEDSKSGLEIRYRLAAKPSREVKQILNILL